MIELNITDFFNSEDPRDYSDSIAKSGQNNIGTITWGNAKDCEHDFVSAMSETEIQELRAFFASFGAWDDSEIGNWNAQELNALLVQDIASQIQEQTDKNGDLYAEDNPIREQVGSSIFRDGNGEVWFYCGD